MAKIICKECGTCIDLEFNSNGVFVCPNCNKNVTCFNYDEKKVAFFNRAYAYVSEQRYELAKKAFDCLVKEFPEEAESYFGYSLAKYEINVLDSHKPMHLFRTLYSESEEFKKAISLATPEQVNVYTEVANQVDEYIKNILKDVSVDNLKPCLTIGKDDLLINKVGKLLKSKNIQSLNLSNEFAKNKKVSKDVTLYKVACSVETITIVISSLKDLNVFNLPYILELAKDSKNLLVCHSNLNVEEINKVIPNATLINTNNDEELKDTLLGVFGIEKEVVKVENKLDPKITPSVLLDKTRDSLALKQFDKAREFIQNLLEKEPNNAEALIYDLLAAAKVSTILQLRDLRALPSDFPEFQKAYEASNDIQRKQLDDAKAALEAKNPTLKEERIYAQAKSLESENKLLEASEIYKTIENFRDSKELAEKCEYAHYEAIYNHANELVEAKDFDKAVEVYASIESFKDSKELINVTKQAKLDYFYSNGVENKNNENYEEAIDSLTTVLTYKDANELIQQCFDSIETNRKEAIYQSSILEEGISPVAEYNRIVAAIANLASIPGYKDSDELKEKYQAIIDGYNAEKAKAEAEANLLAKKKKKKKRIGGLIGFLVSLSLVGAAAATFLYFLPNQKQNDIQKLIDEGRYEEAQKLLSENRWFDKGEKLQDMLYAGEAFNNLDYETGIDFVYNAGGTVEVSYNGNGGNPSKQEDTIARKMSYIDADASKEGYTFVDWVLEPEYKIDAANLTAKITLKASYQVVYYTLTYNLDGGSCDDLVYSYSREDTVTLPTPTRKGYTFIGWKEEKFNGSTLENVSFSNSIGNKTYTAIWEANRYEVTLECGFEGGDAGSQQVTYDGEYHLPKPGERAGYTFTGYVTQDGQPFDSNGQWNIDEDITLTATWAPNSDTKYVVRHHYEALQTGNYDQIVVTENLTGVTASEVIARAAPIPGFTLKSSSVQIKTVKADGTTVFDFYYKRDSYTLSFVTNGGESIDSIPLKFEQELSPSVIATRTGFTFDTWYMDYTQMTKFEKMPANDQTVYAHYSEETKAYYFNPSIAYNEATVNRVEYNILENVRIPTYIGGYPVTSIEPNAFQDNTKLKEIIIPESVTSIGAAAFQGCINLEKVTGTAQLAAIRESTFENCSSLTSTVDMSSATIIENNAFKGCNSLQNVVLSESITTIGNYAFDGCASLVTVMDLTNVTTIGNFAFRNNTLKSLVSLNGNASFGEAVLDFCSNLAVLSISFQRQVEQFYIATKLFGSHSGSIANPSKYHAFGENSQTYHVPISLKTLNFYSDNNKIPNDLANNLSSLTDININNDNITSVGARAFRYCTNITSINLGNVVTIGNYAFANSGLNKLNTSEENPDGINLPESLTSIGNEAFNYCMTANSITLPSSLLTIGSKAFANMYSVTTLDVPSSVTSIGSQAFERMISLVSLHLPFLGHNASNPSELGYFFGTTSSGGCYAATQNSSTYYFPSTLKTISVDGSDIISDAFANLANVTTLILGDDVENIAHNCLRGMSKLETLSLPRIESVTETNNNTITTDVPLSYSINLNYTASYPWALSGSYYRSGNYHVQSTTSTMRVNFSSTGSMTFESYVSSESGWDKLTITHYYNNGSSSVKIVDAISGSTSPVQNTISVNNGDYLLVTYSKDSSSDVGDDRAYFRIVTTSGASVNSTETIITTIPGCLGALFGTNSFSNSTYTIQNGTSYYIPNYLKTVNLTNCDYIDEFTFQNCSRIENISISEQVSEIKQYAFAGCTSLKTFNGNNIESLTIQDSVTSIGDRAFYNVSNVKSLTINENVTYIGNGAFYGMSSLMTVVIPFIGNSADSENSFATVFAPSPTSSLSSSIKNVTITSDTTLPTKAFYNCSYIQSITLPSKVSSISNYAFYGCSSLVALNGQAVTNLVIADSVTSIGSYAFAGLSQVETLSVPENVTYIGSFAFSNMENLESVNLPFIGNSISSPNFFNDVFDKELTSSHETKLKDVTITLDVSIPTYAFDGLSQIQNVTLPEGVTNIPNYAFRNCTNLVSVNKQNDNNFGIFETVSSIGNYAFSGCTNLTTIKAGQNLTSLGSYAFQDCTSLVSCELPKIDYISPYAFQNCTSLTSFDIYDFITTVGNYAFNNCSSLLIAPNLSNATVGNYAFNDCRSLTVVEGLKHASLTGKYIFRNCDNLTTLTINSENPYDNNSPLSYLFGQTATSVDNYYTTSFDGTYYIPKTLVEINYSSTQNAVPRQLLRGFKNVETFNVTCDIYNIGQYAFESCSKISSLDFGSELERIDAYAFASCTSLKSISEVQNLSYLGSNSFSGCTSLKSFNSSLDGEVILGNHITSVGLEVFKNCILLTKLKVEDSALGISYGAFGGMSNLSSMDIPSISVLGYSNSNSYMTVKNAWATSGNYYRAAHTSTGHSKYTMEIEFNVAGTFFYDAYVSNSFNYFSLSISLNNRLLHYATSTSVQSYSVPVSIGDTLTITSSATTYTVYSYFKATEFITNNTIGDFFGNSSYSNSYLDNGGCYIPNSLQTIKVREDQTVLDGAFAGLSKIKVIELSNATEIGKDVFKGCTSLTSINAQKVKIIGKNAFKDCTSLKSFNSDKIGELNILDGALSIGESAFENCVCFTSINLPSSIKNLGKNVFKGVSSLKTLVTPTTHEPSTDAYTVSSNGFMTNNDSYYVSRHNLSGYTYSVSFTFNYDGIFNFTAFKSSSTSYLTYTAALNGISKYTFSYSSATYSLVVQKGDIFSFSSYCSSSTYLSYLTINSFTKSSSDEFNFGYIFGNESYSDSYVIANGNYIPSSLKELTILNGRIRSNQFLGLSSVTKLILEDEVEMIEDAGLAGLSSLKELVIPDLYPSSTNGTLGRLFGTTSYAGANETVQYSVIYYIPSSLSKLTITTLQSTINNYAFANCVGLSTIELVDGIQTIGAHAFDGCINLSKFNATASITSLGDYAFARCVSLKEYSTFEGLTEIPSHAFCECTNLMVIGDFETIESIGDEAFSSTYKLGEISLSENTTFIGDYAFYYSNMNITSFGGLSEISQYAFAYCTNIKELPNMDNITNIGNRAFMGCSGIEEITFSYTTTFIEDGAFSYCSSLSTINSFGNISHIGAYVFDNCTALVSIASLDGVTSIGSGTFRSCISLLNIPELNSVTSISSYLFSGCTSLSNVVITDNITTIGTEAFANSSITTIEIPSSITSIGYGAFKGTSLLSLTIPTSVTSLGQNLLSNIPTLSYLEIPFVGSSRTSTSPLGYIFSRSTEEGFVSCEQNGTTYDIPAGLTTVVITDDDSIPAHAFENLSMVTSITVPDGYTALADYVFAGCTSLTSLNGTGINLPDTLQTIGNYALANVPGTSIDLPASVTSIGNYAFQNWTTSELILSDTIMHIGEGAFAGVTGYSEITLPFIGADRNSDETFGYIFGQTDMGGFVTLEQKGIVYNIPQTLVTVTITDDTSLPFNAFENCVTLGTITIPDTVSYIGDYAFFGCTYLNAFNGVGFNLPTSIDSIGNYAFANVVMTPILTLPSSLREIGDHTFEGCALVPELDIPSSVTSIGEAAFAGASSLERITLPFVGQTKTDEKEFGFIFGTESFNGSMPVTHNSVTYYVPSSLVDVTIGGGIIGSRSLANLSNIRRLTIQNNETIIRNDSLSGMSSLQTLTVPELKTYTVTSSTPTPGSLNYSLTTSGITSYGWELNGSYYRSTNRSYSNSTATMRVSFLEEGSMKISYYVSSELNGDKLTITKYTNSTGTTTTLVNDISGVTSPADQDISVKNGDYLTITYSKNGSTMQNDDRGYFRIVSTMRAPETITYKQTIGSIFGTSSFVGSYQAEQNGQNWYIPNSLKNVILTSATSISNETFSNCSGIEQITIPEEVTSIGNKAFFNCSSLNSLNGSGFNLPASLIEIGDDAFNRTSISSTITLPDTLESIGKRAFAYWEEVTELTIPNTVTSLGEGVFFAMSSLTTLNIPFIGQNRVDQTHPLGWYFGEVSYANSYPVSQNGKTYYIPTSLTSITITDNTIVEDYTFINMSSLVTVNIPDSVTEIGAYAFYNCANLANFNGVGFNLPDGVTSIRNFAFAYASKFESLPLPSSLTVIGSGAFLGCNNVQELVIPDSVTNIGSGAFAEMMSLESLTIPFIGSSISDTTKTMHYFFGITDDGHSYSVEINEATYWIPNALTTITVTNASIIPAFGFYALKNISTINISDDVTTIGTSAFYNCRALINMNGVGINLPSNLQTIGGNAFTNCMMMPIIHMPNSLRTIINYAFSNCSLISELIIPNSVTSIYEGAFSGMINLTSLTVPFIGSSRAGNYEFGYIFGTVIVSQAASIIHNSIKYYIPNSLVSVIVTDVTTIGDYAFANYSHLQSIKIPNVSSIGLRAFDACASLSKFNSDENNTLILNLGLISVGNYAFRDCRSIYNVSIPATLTNIGTGIFNGAYNIENLTTQKLYQTSVAPSYTTLNSGTYYFTKSSNNFTATMSSGNYSSNRTTTLTITKPGTIEYFAYVSGSSTTFKIYINNVLYKTVTETSKNYYTLKVDAGDEIKLVASASTYTRYAYFGITGLTTSRGIGPLFGNVFYSQSYADGNTYYLPEKLTKVTLDGITNLETGAFSGSKNIETININDNLGEIGNSAFEGCTSLKYMNSETGINLPNQLLNLGERAFKDCTSIENVHIPSSVMRIRKNCFENCTALTNVVIDGDVEVGDDAFNGCTSLSSVSFSYGSRMLMIGARAFKNCSSLTSISLDEQLISIGDNAFQNTSLTSISIPSSISVLGQGILSGVKTLATLEAGHIGRISSPDDTIGYFFGTTTDTTGFTIVDQGSFTYHIPSSLRTVTLNSIVHVSNFAFKGCNMITRINLPDKVVAIGSNAFQGCTSLKYMNSDSRIVLPSSLGSINSYAFEHCTSIEYVDFNSSISLVNDAAFAYCTNLKSVSLLGVFSTISSSCFENCSSLQSVELNSNILVLELNSFKNCTSLSSITMTDSVTSIGDFAFQGCSSLENITLSNNLARIGNNAFEGTSLVSLTIPESVTEVSSEILLNVSTIQSIETSFIGSPTNPLLGFGYLFGSATHSFDRYQYVIQNAHVYTVPKSLRNVTINNVTTIYDEAFRGCSYITTINFTEDITSIGIYAFEGCTSLSSFNGENTLNLPTTLEMIGSYAFSRTGFSGEISLPYGLLEIGAHAFDSLPSVLSIIVPETVTTIYEGAFAQNPMLSRIELPFVGHVANDSEDFGYVFGDSAFDESYQATQSTGTYYIPEALTEIVIGGGNVASRALANLTSVTKLTIGDNSTFISENALFGLSNLEELSVPEIRDRTVTTTNTIQVPEIPLSYSLNLSVTASYPWSLSGSYYHSGNKGAQSSTSTMRVNFTDSGIFTFAFYVSSESNYDKLTITHYKGSQGSTVLVNAISGTTTSEEKSISVAANHYLEIKYVKDSSVDRNDDCGYFKIVSAVNTPATTREETTTTTITGVLGALFSKNTSYTNSMAIVQSGNTYHIPSSLRLVKLKTLPSNPGVVFQNCSHITVQQITA